MPVFQSRLRTGSEEFAKNRADMLALVDRLAELNARPEAMSERRRDRFHERGQLSPRERLSRLLDPGMPFLELKNLSGHDPRAPAEKDIPGGGNIVGIGFIEAVRCVIVVDDSGINAGAMTGPGGNRTSRAQVLAREKKMPFVHLVESAGGDLLNYKVEGFVAGGGLFYRLALLSAAGVPVVSILHGSSTAGGAYMPGLSDYVVSVKGRGRAFLAGPPLLKAATGEIATEEQLGGAEMHATVSGLGEYLAEDDAQAILMTREVIDRLSWNSHCPKLDRKSFSPPVLDPEEIAGIVPIDYRRPYDVREIVARIVDGSDFLDFKPGYGVSTVCMQAEVFGHAVGILGNNGPIDPDGATKATQFIQLCDQAQTPIVFLQNITGYMVGTEYERAGMIKHGSKMIQAVSNVRVPRITFMVGASFGAGNYGMCGQGYEPDFIFTWPNAKTGVMGGEQAAKTMRIVSEAGAARRSAAVDTATLDAEQARLAAHFDNQSDAFYTSGKGIDDGMIDPRHTRKVLGFLLDTCWEAKHRTLQPNAFGVGRM
ncbi:MAG: acyl-CoA carboxylase subunit beta [Bradyrhizobium sp.]